MKKMHKLYTLTVLIILLSMINLPVLYAQVDLNTKGFSFQGYARNSGGAALSSKAIEVQFTIYPDGGSAVFTENHTSVTTDAFGVFHLIIGSISTTSYKALDFANNNDYFLKVETKIVGETFATISDAEMQSVPYAQAADNGVPVGSIIIFAGTKANIPPGWLACDGSSVPQSTYPKLYDAIGNAWGVSGSNFNLPDLRAMFIRGVTGTRNDGRQDPEAGSRATSTTGGSGNSNNDVGSYQGDGFEDHGHSLDPPSTATDSQGSHTHALKQLVPPTAVGYTDILPSFTMGVNPVEINFGTNDYMTAAGDHQHNLDIAPFNTDGAFDGTPESETRPRNAYVWYIIRAR